MEAQSTPTIANVIRNADCRLMGTPRWEPLYAQTRRLERLLTSRNWMRAAGGAPTYSGRLLQGETWRMSGPSDVSRVTSLTFCPGHAALPRSASKHVMIARSNSLTTTNVISSGESASRTAWTVALGFAVGMFPLLGVTTITCAIIARVLRLKQTAIQFGNYAALPFQILLIVPFLRLG